MNDTTLKTRSLSVAMALAVLALVVAVGCNLPGLPAGPDGIEPDAGGTDVSPPRLGGPDTLPGCDEPPEIQQCEPGAQTCGRGGTGIMRCNACGTEREYLDCGEAELCQDGRCQPVENRCDTDLPFRISTSLLSFESNDRLRTDSDQIVVENCIDFSIDLQGASVQHDRPEDYPIDLDVFSIASFFDVDDVTIPPGEDVPVTLRYEPTHGFFTDAPARFELGIVGPKQPYTVDIPIERRLHCVSTPPVIDLAAWQGGDGTSLEVPVFNCGNEAAVVTRPTLDELELESVALSSEADESQTRELAPGEQTRFRYQVEGRRPGHVAFELPFESRRPSTSSTSSRTETTTTMVRGRIDGHNCSEPEAISAPMVRPGKSEEWQSAHQIRLAPGEPLEVRTPQESELSADQIWLSHAPDRSHSQLHPASDPQHDYLRFTPDTPGTYNFAYRGIGESGQPSCDTETFRLEVVPEVPLYVELTWQTRDDPIPGDEGYGRGMDLNLHVDVIDGADSSGPTDCFQRGDRASHACKASGGVRQVSVAGGGSETIAFRALEDRDFEIAVRAYNSYTFSGAEAELRVYVDGELLDLGGTDDEPLTFEFGSTAGAIWQVGTYFPPESEEDAGEFELVDRLRKEIE